MNTYLKTYFGRIAKYEVVLYTKQVFLLAEQTNHNREK